MSYNHGQLAHPSNDRLSPSFWSLQSSGTRFGWKHGVYERSAEKSVSRARVSEWFKSLSRFSLYGPMESYKTCVMSRIFVRHGFCSNFAGTAVSNALIAAFPILSPDVCEGDPVMMSGNFTVSESQV